ncbi:arginine succinyltransferase [Halopseudomonas xinjiangensis]|uniref:Arginine N-succinyltransferase n=1 Tax=Halopseudomonas xinjiangensis TaxID=487184 RepID=A0A1H1U7R5_9GAMM|nr:arginine N-succinyltransferase [Halopseudomonas xinjiangensis]SDS68397.1 arginine succinyltransferase [Halopseudomonas xinjiangensis]
MLVRAARVEDLDRLLHLAGGGGSGLTSLPASEERLAQRLESVQASFEGGVAPADADYLFVLEDEAGQVVGTSGMLAAAGLREPWYSYRMGLTVTASRELNVYQQHPTLFLVNDLTGATALCSYYYLPSERRGIETSRLLSKARFLFIAEFAAEFSPRVIVEMRGLSDIDGRSPFWDSLGKHFFRMEFARADYLTGIGSKAFIAEMMPKFPLYACFLSQAAREAIGQVHPDSELGLAMFREEGLTHQGYIDIFDGGPTLEAPLAQVRAISESRLLVLATGTPGDEAETFLIHNRGRQNCRIIAAPARMAAGTLVVSIESAERLGLRAGSPVRAVSLVGRSSGGSLI